MEVNTVKLGKTGFSGKLPTKGLFEKVFSTAASVWESLKQSEGKIGKNWK